MIKLLARILLVVALVGNTLNSWAFTGAAKDDANCVAAWTFTEGTGTTVDDVSSNSNTGTFKSAGHPEWNNASLPKTYVNWVLDFKNTNAYIGIGTSDAFKFDASDFSAVAWVYCDTADGANSEDDIIRRQTTDSNANGTWGFHVGEWGASNQKYGISTNDGSWHDMFANTQLSLTTWTHIAFSADNDGNVSFFFNGSADGTPTLVKPGNSSGYFVSIGGYYNGGSTTAEVFGGKLGEVAVFNRLLSSTEINDIMNNGLAGATAATSYRTFIQNAQLNNARIFQ
jgi:hypothetical protein